MLRLVTGKRRAWLGAAVVLVRPEEDGDYHVVLSAAGAHMIAEAPMPGCTVRAAPILRSEMATARGAVRLCRHAVVTGVAFFDYDHGQTASHRTRSSSIRSSPFAA